MAPRTDDETILKLWGLNWSKGEIAQAMGLNWSKGEIAQAMGLNRNQVSGKLFRLGAPKREGQKFPPSDLIGQRFCRLLVLSRAENTPNAETQWECRCDCGKVKIILGASLRRGQTLSCGCLRASPFWARRPKGAAA